MQTKGRKLKWPHLSAKAAEKQRTEDANPRNARSAVKRAQWKKRDHQAADASALVNRRYLSCVWIIQ